MSNENGEPAVENCHPAPQGELLIIRDARPTRADAVKNRALLLQTAQRLFDERAIDDVSMAEIAEAAGVGKGTLYRHFDNKAAVCLALLDQDERDLQNRVLEHLRTHADAPDNLRWFMREVAHFVDANDTILRAAADRSNIAILGAPSQLWRRQTIYGLLAQILAGRGADLDYMADTLYVMLDVQTIRFQRRALGYDLPRIIAGLNTLLTRLIT